MKRSLTFGFLLATSSCVVATAIQIPIAIPAQVVAPSTAKASGDFRNKLASATGDLSSDKATPTTDSKVADTKKASTEHKKDCTSDKLSRSEKDDTSTSVESRTKPHAFIPNLVVPVQLTTNASEIQPVTTNLTANSDSATVVQASDESPVIAGLAQTKDELSLLGTNSIEKSQNGSVVKPVLTQTNSTSTKVSAESANSVNVASLNATPDEVISPSTTQDEAEAVPAEISSASISKPVNQKFAATVKNIKAADTDPKTTQSSREQVEPIEEAPVSATALDNTTIADSSTAQATQIATAAVPQVLKTAEIIAGVSNSGTKNGQAAWKSRVSVNNIADAKDVKAEKTTLGKVDAASSQASKSDKTTASKSKPVTSSEPVQQKDEKTSDESTGTSPRQFESDIASRHAVASDSNNGSSNVTAVQTQPAAHIGVSDVSTASTNDSPQTGLNVPVLTRDAVAAEPPATISSGKLIEKLNGSELRVALRTDELGSISIATSISSQHLAADIYVDKGETARAFAAELPTLNAKLQDEHGLTSNIVMHETPQFSSNSDQRQQQQQFTQGPRYIAESLEGTADVQLVAEPSSYVSYGDGLDVRA